MTARVTIITPVYNAAFFIESFVCMLCAQSVPDWICLFIDDGSTDNTRHIIRSISVRDYRFTLIEASRPGLNQGPAFARNVGIKNAFTPLIAFCDVDDIWHPQKLELQLPLHADMQTDISFTAYARFLVSTDASPISYRCPPAYISYRRLLGGNPLPLSACILSRSLFLNGFAFPPVKHEDFALWLGIFNSLPAVKYKSLPLVLMYYRIHGSNITSNRLLMCSWAYKVFRYHGLGHYASCVALLNWILYQARSAVTDFFPSTCKVTLPVSSLLAMPPLRLEQVV